MTSSSDMIFETQQSSADIDVDTMLYNSIDADMNNADINIFGVTTDDHVDGNGNSNSNSNSNSHVTPQVEGQRRDNYNNDYRGLLQSMTQLKSDLEQSTSRATVLQNENTILHREQAALKTKLSSVETRYNETKKSLLQFIDKNAMNVDRARELNVVESKWRSLVNRERTELQEQRELYLNQRSVEQESAQNLRSDIRNEMEREYEERIEVLIKEKDEMEEKYHTMRRQHELGQVQNTVVINTLTKEVEVATKSKEDEVATLKEALSAHVERNADSDGQLDQLRMEVAEGKSQIEMMVMSERELRKELQEALDGRVKEESMKHAAISTYEINLTETRSSLALKEAECQASSIEVGHLKKSIEALNITLKQKSEEVSSSSRMISALEVQLKDKEDSLHQLREDYKVERHRIDGRFKTELGTLKEENSSLLRQKQIMETHLAEGRAELNQMKTELIVKEETARREIEVRVNNMVLENSKLLLKVSNLECELKLKEADYHNSMDKLLSSCETYKHDSKLIASENDALSKKCSLLEEALEEVKAKNRDCHKEIESVSLGITKLQRELEACEEKLCDEETEKSVLKTKLEKSIREQQEMESVFQKENEQLQSEIKSLTSKYESGRQAMREQEKKYKSQISKEKRKAECYKEKAIDAHTKNIHAKHLLRQKGTS